MSKDEIADGQEKSRLIAALSRLWLNWLPLRWSRNCAIFLAGAYSPLVSMRGGAGIAAAWADFLGKATFGAIIGACTGLMLGLSIRLFMSKSVSGAAAPSAFRAKFYVCCIAVLIVPVWLNALANGLIPSLASQALSGALLAGEILRLVLAASATATIGAIIAFVSLAGLERQIRALSDQVLPGAKPQRRPGLISALLQS